MFSIMKCQIDCEQISILLESIKTCENLKFINLSENPLNYNNCLTDLTQTLTFLEHIELVALNNCNIGTKGFCMILQVLKDKSHMKDLYLANNDI